MGRKRKPKACPDCDKGFVMVKKKITQPRNDGVNQFNREFLVDKKAVCDTCGGLGHA